MFLGGNNIITQKIDDPQLLKRYITWLKKRLQKKPQQVEDCTADTLAYAFEG